MTAKAASNTPPSVKIKIVTICSPNSISRKSLVGVQRLICSPKDDMAGVPAMPAITMTAFTYGHAVVRLKRHSHSYASSGSRRAIVSPNTMSSSSSKSAGSGTCRIIPGLRRF